MTTVALEIVDSFSLHCSAKPNTTYGLEILVTNKARPLAKSKWILSKKKKNNFLDCNEKCVNKSIQEEHKSLEKFRTNPFHHMALTINMSIVYCKRFFISIGH